MICGVVKTINVTSEDLELVEFMLTHNERVAKQMPTNESRTNMERMHTNLRNSLNNAK